MSLHEPRRSPARRIDDTQLLQGLLTQQLYVNEHDRRLLRVLLAETPQLRITQRAPRHNARRLRASGRVALGGALALALGSPLLPVFAASPPPTAWIASTERAAVTLAQPADDALLRALLNHIAIANQAGAPATQSTPPASDALLRALLNRTATASQADPLATQTRVPAGNAVAQAALAVGETLLIPAAPAATNTTTAASNSYYVVQPGDTLSSIAQAYYGNGDLWLTIFNANTDKIANPHWIYPNQQLVIPAVSSASTIPSTPAQTGKGPGQYTVKSGDTLSGIANYAYGNGDAWWGIYQANASQIANPNLIYPGQVLTIP